MYALTSQKEIQHRLTKSLLDFIVLRLIAQESMHGYQVIAKTRQTFGVYLGPSTVYPLMANLEKKGYVSSQWDTSAEKPRKIFSITDSGRDIIRYTEDTLDVICKTCN